MSGKFWLSDRQWRRLEPLLPNEPCGVPRFYSEQYLLAAHLLGGAGGDAVVFPGMFVSGDPASRQVLHPLLDDPRFSGVEAPAGGFWLEKG